MSKSLYYDSICSSWKFFLSQLYSSSSSRNFNKNKSFVLVNHEKQPRSLDILIFGLWKWMAKKLKVVTTLYTGNHGHVKFISKFSL